MLRVENRILRLIAGGASIESTMQELCSQIQAILPDVICTVAGVEPGGLFRLLAAPSLPASFFELAAGVVIGPETGSCGSAAFLREPVLTVDIERDPKWTKYRELSLAHGLRACWSSPVVVDGGGAVAVVAFYFREPREPFDAERAAMSCCIDLCMIAWRRLERVIQTERRANIDALTGLPNRATFNEILAALPTDQIGSWAIFAADLDNLKTVNDTFGHKCGDALIRTAAHRIAQAALPDLTFRLGGDEFAIVIQDPEALADLHRLASRIFDALEQPADCDGQSVIPRATIGGAVLGSTADLAKTVHDCADFALYHAKETGRGGFVRYWPGIGSRITHRLDAIRDVSAALKDGRIEAHYQPIVRLDTREIIGIEALCRMRTPDGDIVAAEAFHEATTDAHVAVELSSHMLEIVAGDVRGWIDQGIPFQHVSVNVCSADFLAGNLRQKVEDIFGRARVPLDHLILEVKEDVYLGQCDRVIAREIAGLRKAGLRIALDDFGTGYASLTHLLSVPVDAIKIDQTFISRLWPEDPSLIIVQGLIDIARQLDIRIVAEGIEAEVQASQLWAMGCRLGQGFEFSRPVDRQQMTRLLRRHAQWVEGALPLYAPNSQPIPPEDTKWDLVGAATA